jgi:hypothetical protein
MTILRGRVDFVLTTLDQRPPRTLDHRAAIARFANGVRDAAVSFHALSYRDWLRTWPLDGPVAQHGVELAKLNLKIHSMCLQRRHRFTAAAANKPTAVQQIQKQLPGPASPV